MEYSMEQLGLEVQNSDMILIGLGEEFEQKKFLNTIPEYVANVQNVQACGKSFLIPFLDGYYLNKCRKELFEAYRNLKKILENKNYFMISTMMNETVYECACFEKDKIVTPCGGFRKLQCKAGCKASLSELSEEQKSMLIRCCEGEKNWEEFSLGTCEQCGEELCFNNIYSEHYLEETYLPQWERYMKWTQGTLNKKVMILELGVGLTYPGMIRWPFEKIAFFNKKASFYRIHASLYQMTEELQDKGISIHKNAVEFLQGK